MKVEYLIYLIVLISMLFTCPLLTAQEHKRLNHEAFHYYMTGKNKKSLKLLEASFRIKNPVAEELYLAGELSTLLNKKTKALDYFKQMVALEHYPINELTNEINAKVFENDEQWNDLLAEVQEKSERYKESILADEEFMQSPMIGQCLKLFNTDISEKDFYLQLSNFNDFKEIAGGSFILFEQNSNQNSYLVYVPSKYDPSKRHPLLVHLHGAVNRSFLPDLTSFNKEYFLTWAEQHQSLILFPLANKELRWNREPGLIHIKTTLKETKGLFNIDDNKVFLTGFSDGGTGVSLLMTVANDPFAGGISYNGIPLSKTRINTKFSLAYQNNGNRFFDLVSTVNDELFNINDVRSVSRNIKKANSKINFREYKDIGHQFGYYKEELSILSNYVKTQKRDPFTAQIEWITGATYFGKSDWIEISKISGYQSVIKPSSLFFPSLHYQGEGVKVDKLISDVPAIRKKTISSAESIELKNADVIIAINNKKVDNYVSLMEVEQPLASINELSIKRDGNSITLNPSKHREDLKTGLFPGNHWIKAQNSNNVINIAVSSAVDEVTIYINPEMVNINERLKVVLNGKLKYDGIINYDKKFIKESFLKFRDRKSIWINKIVISTK